MNNYNLSENVKSKKEKSNKIYQKFLKFLKFLLKLPREGDIMGDNVAIARKLIEYFEKRNDIFLILAHSGKQSG